jgi:tRNA U34 5-methylaminomethyl-2-thiouridine-forming methyltransferase MnmC
MQQNIFQTEDGSHSIIVPGWNATYHSRHGAIQESLHIFIEAGLKPLLKKNKELSVFEMGFGTGLNALLTIIATESLTTKINYRTAETDPLEIPTASSLNYTKVLERPDLQTQFMQLHESPWESWQIISEKFSLFKQKADITDIKLTSTFDLIYFDAFDPVTQPDLWTFMVFKKLYNSMREGGVLVTYSSKGIVRRAMNEAGFIVEKLPGPIGKKEIVRAIVIGKT